MTMKGWVEIPPEGYISPQSDVIVPFRRLQEKMAARDEGSARHLYLVPNDSVSISKTERPESPHFNALRGSVFSQLPDTTTAWKEHYAQSHDGHCEEVIVLQPSELIGEEKIGDTELTYTNGQVIIRYVMPNPDKKIRHTVIELPLHIAAQVISDDYLAEGYFCSPQYRQSLFVENDEKILEEPYKTLVELQYEITDIQSGQLAPRVEELFRLARKNPADILQYTWVKFPEGFQVVK
jgi:hypothetical protein